VHRLTDPPQRIEPAGGADRKTITTELNPDRGDRQRYVNTIVDE
jgi:hypothetical protein